MHPALTQNCHHFRFKCVTAFGSVVDPDVTTSQVSTTEVTTSSHYTTSSSHYTIDGNLKSIPKINTAFNACNRCITVISSEWCDMMCIIYYCEWTNLLATIVHNSSPLNGVWIFTTSSAVCPGPTTLIGTTVTVKLLSGSGWSME